jgi:cyclomaltodextrinase
VYGTIFSAWPGIGSNDDDFWRGFRQVVKTANPDAYICGEIWTPAQRWLKGDQFDAVMNYLFMDAAVSFFGAETLRLDYKREHLKLEPLDVPAFAKAIDDMHELYDWEVNHVQLNLLDSHDTARALWIMGEDTSALRLCVLCQITMPGAPCIYYGDDPACRGAFPWDNENEWDSDLLTCYRRAVALRHRYPVLRTGTFEPFYAKDRVYAFHRKLEQQEAIVVFNAATTATTCQLPVEHVESSSFYQVWPEEKNDAYQVNENHFELVVPARNALVLLNKS